MTSSANSDNRRMLAADQIARLHDQLTARWHEDERRTPGAVDEWLERVARQHRANFDLWHIEDEARTPGATDADVAG